jgi:hypothetical protein
VGEDLSLEAKLADGLAVSSRLLAGGRRCEFDVCSIVRIVSWPGLNRTLTIYAKLIESPSDFDLGVEVEVCTAVGC